MKSNRFHPERKNLPRRDEFQKDLDYEDRKANMSRATIMPSASVIARSDVSRPSSMALNRIKSHQQACVGKGDAVGGGGHPSSTPMWCRGHDLPCVPCPLGDTQVQGVLGPRVARCSASSLRVISSSPDAAPRRAASHPSGSLSGARCTKTRSRIFPKFCARRAYGNRRSRRASGGKARAIGRGAVVPAGPVAHAIRGAQPMLVCHGMCHSLCHT